MASDFENTDEDAAAGRAGRRRRPLAPGLYLLSTPIGAADDITVRGLAALREADALGAEDTRTLRKLLDLHGIGLNGRPLMAYHEHNARSAGPKLLDRLAAGERVVYASEAGTPLIADPGFRLARAAREAGVAVRALPGPSALLAALVVSGQPTDRFAFGGFAPPKSSARRRFFGAWRETPGTLVFFESGRRLAESLGDMAAVFGDRPATVARELTKSFEETRDGGLAELAAAFAQSGPPKGELVVLIGPGMATPPSPEAIDAALLDALKTERTKDAARTVANMFGAKAQEVYKRAVDLSESKGRRDDRDD